MDKFKVGDLVLCIGPAPGIAPGFVPEMIGYIGKRGSIAQITNGDWIGFDTVRYLWRPSWVKKIDSKFENFKKNLLKE